MRFLGVPFFIISIVMTSCITYDPSLYISETVSYVLASAVEIDQRIQTVSIEPEGFGRALRIHSGFNRRFEPLSGAGKLGDGDILSEKKTELFYSLLNRISPGSKSYIVEIRPIISYESWPFVYDLMKFGAWNTAMERLLRDREEFTAENTRAEFDYVIGSIYHVLGDLEQAESYLKKALKGETS